jgi:AraC family transcriptional regulator
VSIGPLASPASRRCRSAPFPKCPKCRATIFSQLFNQGLLFAELVHPACQAVPTHTHHTAFYHLTLTGFYSESTARGIVAFGPLASAFTRSDTTHYARAGSAGAHIFSLEIGPSRIQELLQLQKEPETVYDCIGGPLSCLGIRLFQEYKAGHAADKLTVDSLVWELLAAAAKLRLSKSEKTPSWWPRVIELIHYDFARDLRISDLAREANVHPVHLARVFRSLSQQTAGEWIQRLRVKAACEKLVASDQSIAEIAAEVGFADQSHLTRTLRRYTNLTPGALRKCFGGRLRRVGRAWWNA